MADITSVDIDTNGTGLFRIVYNHIAATSNTSIAAANDLLSPDSNDDASSNNTGNYSRRKRKVKGSQELPTSTSTSTPQHDRHSKVVEQRQLVMTSAIPSQLSLWLDRLRHYRHLDRIS